MIVAVAGIDREVAAIVPLQLRQRVTARPVVQPADDGGARRRPQPVRGSAALGLPCQPIHAAVLARSERHPVAPTDLRRQGCAGETDAVEMEGCRPRADRCRHRVAICLQLLSHALTLYHRRHARAAGPRCSARLRHRLADRGPGRRRARETQGRGRRPRHRRPAHLHSGGADRCCRGLSVASCGPVLARAGGPAHGGRRRSSPATWSWPESGRNSWASPPSSRRSRSACSAP